MSRRIKFFVTQRAGQEANPITASFSEDHEIFNHFNLIPVVNHTNSNNPIASDPLSCELRDNNGEFYRNNLPILQYPDEIQITILRINNSDIGSDIVDINLSFSTI